MNVKADKKAHIILTPTGSAGDVHPFIGTGKMLRQRGHEVTIITGGPFKKAVKDAGLEFVEFWTDEEFDEITNNPNLWHPRKGLKLILKTCASGMRRHFESLEKVYRPGKSVIVLHTLSFGARVFVEAKSAPSATLHIAPSCFRSCHEMPAFAPGFTLSRWPGFMKRLMWWTLDRVFVDPHLVGELNQFRSELGLEKISRPFDGWLHSPDCVVGLFPSWFGEVQPDWPAHSHATGFPLFDETGQHAADQALEQFLNEGEPPIAFTPGSAMAQGKQFFAAAIEASRQIGKRALLLTKYDDHLPATLPDHVYRVRYVPFSQVLPRCAAFVHHGGIGSSGQGLAAGVPHLVMPMGFDQPDNATRLQRLGVADWVSPGKFTPKRVAAKLAALLASDEVAAACAKWAKQMQLIDANVKTCELIEDIMNDEVGGG